MGFLLPLVDALEKSGVDLTDTARLSVRAQLSTWPAKAKAQLTTHPVRSQALCTCLATQWSRKVESERSQTVFTISHDCCDLSKEAMCQSAI